jgi:hypothetical protein
MFNKIFKRVCYLTAYTASALNSPSYGLTSLLTSMVTLSSYWEDNQFITSRNSLHFMELDISLPRYKSPPPVPILSHNNPVHVPHSTSWRPILILSSHLLLGLSSGLFQLGFLTKTLYAPLLSPYVLRAPSIYFFYFITWIFGKEYRL